MAKMIYRKDTGEILGVHIIGLHAADLIHEASNAVATKQSVQVQYLTMRNVCVTSTELLLQPYTNGRNDVMFFPIVCLLRTERRRMTYTPF